jgi:hypothetical protein
MAQAVLQLTDLPEGALDAAAAFYALWAERVHDAIAETDEALVLVLPAAGYEHNGWRRAAVQELARQAAPKRVNAIAGDDPEAIAHTIDWLAQAPGITGQVLPVVGVAAASA